MLSWQSYLWWSRVLRFIQSLAKLDADSLHARILRENSHDAYANLFVWQLDSWRPAV